MSRQFNFTIWLEVNDEKQLLDAARAHPHSAGMVTEDFYDNEGNINVGTCLVMLLDPGSLPGVDIQDSGAVEQEG